MTAYLTSKTTLRGALKAAIVLGTLTLSSQAFAVSGAVKAACMSDYFAYCSQHEVGSPGLRSCMRAAGPKLSSRCIGALVAAGEVSQAEVSRRSTKTASTK